MSRASFYEQADRHSAHAAALSRTWSDPPTFLGWLCTNNHKAIGRRFVVTAFGFFIVAGVLAAVIRAQLAFPDGSLVAGVLENTPQNLVQWIMRPQHIRPITAMPDVRVREKDARDIAAYLGTLSSD